MGCMRLAYALALVVRTAGSVFYASNGVNNSGRGVIPGPL